MIDTREASYPDVLYVGGDGLRRRSDRRPTIALETAVLLNTRKACYPDIHNVGGEDVVPLSVYADERSDPRPTIADFSNSCPVKILVRLPTWTSITSEEKVLAADALVLCPSTFNAI